MIRIRRPIIFCLVATDTGVWCVDVVSIMAIITICNVGMFSSQWIEAIVIKSSWNPGHFIVTHNTVSWEIRRSMIRIGRVVIINLMTTDAGVGRVIVISIVAIDTIIGDGGMSPH